MSTQPANGRDKVNILLVDDSEAKLLSHEVVLAEIGERLFKASSAREAFECLLKNEVALILIDVCMPELDGFELAAMIREHPRFQRTAIIFVSAVNFAHLDQLRGYQLGGVDYVSVPVVPELLRAKVKVFVDLFRKTRQLERFNAELEQRVRERTAQLEAANKELESFAYSVSHDLRAPLRGIDGWSLALAEDYAEQFDERAHQYLERVRSETQRMGLLIDDMLQLSRVTRTEMRVSDVDLTSAARRIAAELSEVNPSRRIEFVIEPNLSGVGDARLLDIALTNLLGNAVKFTGPRAIARIEFGRAEQNGETAFYVRDNGVGFDMAYAGSLFGAFQRLHKASEFPGTGIGLATVQRVIHRHGGRLWTEAQVDRGATFYFTILENP